MRTVSSMLQFSNQDFNKNFGNDVTRKHYIQNVIYKIEAVIYCYSQAAQ